MAVIFYTLLNQQRKGMKETFYFPHDYNARNDMKIQALISEHGALGYGVYWIIIEILHEQFDKDIELDDITFLSLARQASTSVEQIKVIVEDCLKYKLLTEENGYIYSKRVNENIDKRLEISEKRAKAGRISAKKRQKATRVEQVLTHVQQNPTKERKGKDIKGNKNSRDITSDFERFWDDYHRITGKAKTDKEAAIKHWKRLNNGEQTKAIENINPYFRTLKDKEYCKKARTYLADKNFNDEFRSANNGEQLKAKLLDISNYSPV